MQIGDKFIVDHKVDIWCNGSGEWMPNMDKYIGQEITVVHLECRICHAPQCKNESIGPTYWCFPIESFRPIIPPIKMEKFPYKIGEEELQLPQAIISLLEK